MIISMRFKAIRPRKYIILIPFRNLFKRLIRSSNGYHDTALFRCLNYTTTNLFVSFIER